MILIFITLIMITGSVAATDSTNNNTINPQHINDNVVKTTTTTSNQPTSTQETTNQETINTSDKSNNTSDSSSGTANSTCTGKQSSTKTTVYNVTSKKGSKITLKSLTTSNNTMVKNGTVEFRINDNIIGTSKVNNGVAKYTYKIPTNWININYTITAAYANNSNYLNSTGISTLKLKSNLRSKTTLNSTNAAQGNTITLNAVVKTLNYGTYAQTGKVTFKVNGRTVGTSLVSNGRANITYTVPKYWRSKTYTIKAVYAKNDYYRTSTGTGKLMVKSYTPKFSLATSSAYSGKDNNITVKVTDSYKRSVDGGVLTFKLKGKIIGKSNVTKGVSSITYSIPSTYNGKYTLTLSYNGFGKYRALTKTTTLSITKALKSNISLTSTLLTSNKSNTLVATVTDTSGNKINGGNTVFIFNNKTIGTATVSKGKANLTYNISSDYNGTYNLTVDYEGYGKYLSSNKTFNVTVSNYTNNNATVNTSNISGEFDKYLSTSKNCQANSTKIIDLAKSLTNGANSTYQAAVKIYNYVRDAVYYIGYSNTRYGALRTLANKKGNCVDQSHLLIALMRAADIPARYCHAKCTFRSGLYVGHVWAEVYVDGKWYSCDTTSRRNSFNNIVNWYKSTTVYRYTSLAF